MKHLFNEFQPASAADWKARLEKDLKGVTFEALSIKDRNDITIQPFYTKEDLPGNHIDLPAAPGWSICEQIVTTNAATANKQALEALNNGASGLCFILENEVDAAVLLNGIELPYIYSCFNIAAAPAFGNKLQDYIKSQQLDIDTIPCFLSNDFINAYLQNGRWNTTFKTQAGEALALFDAAPQLAVDAALFQNAGANSTTELGYTLALVNEHLTLLQDNNKLLQLKKLHVTVATDTNFYEQIAKLRALRSLLHLLLEQYNLHIPVHIHAETSHIYRSAFDSYSNLLRDTLAGMAAVLGNCNSLYIHTFDETLRQPGDFSKRMSRNQQLLFKEESYLDKVADAAAGSYYLEQLTAQLSAKAWDIFKDTEATGGLIESFGKGTLQQHLSQQAQQLILDYKEGKRVLIGVNKFPNATDAPQPADKQPYEGNGIRPILLSQEIL